MSRFNKDHKSLAFRDNDGNIHENLELIVVEGTYDHQKHKYVDPPRVTTGFGCVRAERVAELVGIKDALR